MKLPVLKNVHSTWTGRVVPSIPTSSDGINRGVASHSWFGKFFADTIKTEVNGKRVYLNRKSCFKVINADIDLDNKIGYKELIKLSNYEVIKKVQDIFNDGFYSTTSLSDNIFNSVKQSNNDKIKSKSISEHSSLNEESLSMSEKVSKIINGRKRLGAASYDQYMWETYYEDLKFTLSEENITFADILNDQKSLKIIFDDIEFRYAIIREIKFNIYLDIADKEEVEAFKLYIDLISHKMSQQYTYLDFDDPEIVKASLPMIKQFFSKEGIEFEWALDDLVFNVISRSKLALIILEFLKEDLKQKQEALEGQRALTDLQATAEFLADRDSEQGQDLVTRLGIEANRNDSEALLKDIKKIFFQLHPDKIKREKTDLEQKRYDDASDLNDLIKNKTYNYYLDEYKMRAYY